MEAKSMAAEAALKYIVKNRQFSAFKKEDCDDKMELGEDGSPTLPWQHVASFALFKLLNSWGEDPNQARGVIIIAQCFTLSSYSNPSVIFSNAGDHLGTATAE
jgi:hypothetical protein